MKKDELKVMMEDILGQSKSLLLRDGYLVPVAFMYSGNDLDIFGLKFRTQKEKDEQIMLLRHIVKMKKADAVIMVVESWYVTSDKKDLSIIPSKHPMRKECIFIIGECGEGNSTIMQKFERNTEKEKEKKERTKKGIKEEIIVFGEKDNTDTDIGFSKLSFGVKDREKDRDKDFKGYA